MIDLVALLEEGLVGAQLFLTYVWGVADDDVEACTLTQGLALAIEEDIGKFQFPVEETLLFCHGSCHIQPGFKLWRLRMLNSLAKGVICQGPPGIAAYIQIVVKSSAQVRQVQ